MLSEPSGGSQPFSEGLCALLKSAGVLKTSVIRVVGQGGLHALLWLCRHGYEQAGFMHGASPAEPAEVVLVPSACPAGALDQILAQASHLRPDGLVVLQTPHGAPGASDTASDTLGRHGFRVERHLSGRHRDVYLARRGAANDLGRVSAAAG
jgi:hypothetical protein